MKLLIHHHTLAYKTENAVYVQSFIGAWVDAIGKNVNQVGLLLHVTDEPNEKLDYAINQECVVLESLGPHGGLANRRARLRFVKEKCRSLTGYTHFIVRGMTPRQKLVMDYVQTERKFFFLVGSLYENKLRQINTIKDLYSSIMRVWRLWELEQISKKARLLANSPILVDEIARMYGKQAVFVPSNTISKIDFCWKEICNKNSYQLLFVGRVEKAKGIEEIIQALALLDKNYKWHLNIIGPCAREYQDYLVSLGNSSVGQFSFKGFIPFGPKLFAEYDAADVYILPSYHEGFPHSIWEAGCRSIPVIATKVGGIPGIVTDDMITFINKHTVVEIKNKVEELLIKNRPQMEIKRRLLWEKTQEITVESAAEILLNQIAS